MHIMGCAKYEYPSWENRKRVLFTNEEVFISLNSRKHQ